MLLSNSFELFDSRGDNRITEAFQALYEGYAPGGIHLVLNRALVST